MAGQLTDKRVLVVGGAKHLGAAVARAAAADGAHVIIGARDLDLAAAVAAELGGDSIHVDLFDELTIVEAARALGTVDHVVVTASAHHNVPLAQMQVDGIRRAFDAKITGPLMLAKHLAPIMPEDGSFVLFSGVAAWNPAAGQVVMGVSNGAVSFLATHLAVELAPRRVNALSPGIIDSGTWDELAESDRNALFEGGAKGALAGRVGTREDIAHGAVYLMSADYVSGETLHVEGGARH